MNPIKEIREELQALEISSRKIRTFTVGLLVISLFYGVIARLKHLSPGVAEGLVAAAFLLMLWSMFYALSLRRFYMVWMGIALSIGWVVSRILLIIIFYLILTPVGLLARLVGKKFLDADFKDKKDSYWIAYNKDRPTDYKRMY